MPTLAIAGDVMLGRLVDQALQTRALDSPWREVRHLIEPADLFFCNLECAVCQDIPQWEPDSKTFHFRLDRSRVGAIHESGVDAVQLANNHVLDHDVDGLLQTLDALDEVGIAHAGAGRTIDDARADARVNAGDVRVSLLAAADHLIKWAAGPRTPGIWIINPGSVASVREIAAAVQTARRSGADVVALGLHWGPNMRRAPPAVFTWFAHKAVEAGVDVVWGTSAHLFQGIEFYHDRVILYDAGDFVDDYAVDPFERNDLSFLFHVALDTDGRCHEVELWPVAIEQMRTREAYEDEAKLCAARMRELCAPMGTRLETRGEHLVATPVPESAPIMA